MAVLTEPQVLVQEPLDAPEHHRDPDDAPGREAGPCGAVGPPPEAALQGDEHAEDREVLQGLEDRDREPLAGLAGVVHAEPLVGRVPPAGHHELWPEQPAHRPGGHEHRRDQVESLDDAQIRATPVGLPDPGRNGEEDPAERR